MSVRTTADEKKDSAKENISNAIKILREVYSDLDATLNPEVWGTNEWNDEYRDKLENAYSEVTNMILDLRKIERNL